jgi:hypothetical protein
MISKFNTNSPSGSTGSSKTIFIIGGLLIAGYLVYRFVIKPRQEKEKEKEKENKE